MMMFGFFFGVDSGAPPETADAEFGKVAAAPTTAELTRKSLRFTLKISAPRVVAVG
jgi:hypothetical protein